MALRLLAHSYTQSPSCFPCMHVSVCLCVGAGGAGGNRSLTHVLSSSLVFLLTRSLSHSLTVCCMCVCVCAQVLSVATVDPQESEQSAVTQVAAAATTFTGCPSPAITPALSVNSLRVLNFTVFTWNVTKFAVGSKGQVLAASSAMPGLDQNGVQFMLAGEVCFHRKFYYNVSSRSC